MLSSSSTIDDDLSTISVEYKERDACCSRVQNYILPVDVAVAHCDGVLTQNADVSSAVECVHVNCRVKLVRNRVCKGRVNE